MIHANNKKRRQTWESTQSNRRLCYLHSGRGVKDELDTGTHLKFGLAILSVNTGSSLSRSKILKTEVLVDHIPINNGICVSVQSGTVT